MAKKVKSKKKSKKVEATRLKSDDPVTLLFTCSYKESQLLAARAERLNIKIDDLLQQCLRAFTDRKVKGGNLGLKITINGLGCDKEGKPIRK